MPQPNPHAPNHIYADDILYFLTGTTLHHEPFLASISHKQHLQEQLFQVTAAYDLKLKAWVILNNHYHILFYLPDSEKLSGFVRTLHTKTAITFNQWAKEPGRQIWWNYWDWCIRDERDYWHHFNYIHYNPVKHGYVQQLRDWPYLSLFTYLKTQGREWLDDCWQSYPIREFTVEHDDFQKLTDRSAKL